MKKPLIAFCLTLILNGSAFAQPDRTEPPEPSAPKSVQLPAVEKSRLKNGIEVWTVERRQVPVVSVRLVDGRRRQGRWCVGYGDIRAERLIQLGAANINCL